MGEEMVKALGEYNRRRAELDRLEQRSDWRFATEPPPPRVA
jgi:hypothetical protein